MNKPMKVPEKTYSTAIKWLAHLESPSLTDEKRAEFMAWLEASEVNQAAYLKAEQLWERGGVFGEIQCQVEKKPPFFSFGAEKTFGFHALYAVSAFVVIAIVAGYRFLDFSSGGYEYQTGIGDQQVVELIDRSTLHLNTSTRVLFEETDRARVLHLVAGEVYLDVNSIPDYPFEVVLDSTVVRVLGTRFSVRRDGSQDTITVLEGRVGMAKEVVSGEAFAPDVILTENQQLILDQSDELAVTNIDANALLSWRNRVLIYKGNPLSEVVGDLNRYFEKKLVLDDSDLGRREVFATIHLSDFDSVSSIIATSLNLERRSNPEGVVLYEKNKKK